MAKKKVNTSKNVPKTKKQEMKKTTRLPLPKTKAIMNKYSRKAKKSNTKTHITVGNGSEEDEMSCHQCGDKGKDCVIDCNKCGSKRYCVDCKIKWYPNVSVEVFRKACPVCRGNCSCNTCLLGLPVDDLHFAKGLDMLNGNDANTNGWLDADDIAEISTEDPNQEQYQNDVINISSGQSTSTDSEMTDNVFDQGADSNDIEGMYRGNAVGVEAKQLQAIEHHYPNTYKWDRIDSTPFWLGVLKELYMVIKGFQETLADDIPEDQISTLEKLLKGLEKIGFDLSWVDNMVKNLKLEHNQLNQDLMLMGDSVRLLKEKTVETKNLYMEAVEMVEKGKSEYDRVKKAVDNNESESRRLCLEITSIFVSGN